MIEKYYEEKKDYNKIGGGRRQGILSIIGDVSNNTVLDIGCGYGHLGKELKKMFPGVKVYGVDISKEAVVEAKSILEKAESVNVEQDDFPDEFKNINYDWIVISEVLEHLFLPERLLEKVKVIIAPDTKILITVPNVLFWKNRFKIFLGYFKYKQSGLMDRGHIHFFTWRTLLEMVYGCGFTVGRTANYCPTRGTKLLGRIWPGLFSYQFIIEICQK